MFATEIRKRRINHCLHSNWRWLNNRAENTQQPFRRLGRAMSKFRGVKTLQKFASVHASIYNHFNRDQHLNRRDIFNQSRSVALAVWRQLAA